mgnify:CR=1 FL=1
MNYSVIVRPIADAKVAQSGSTSNLVFDSLSEATKCYNKHVADVRLNMWLLSELWMFASIEITLIDETKQRAIESIQIYSF